MDQVTGKLTRKWASEMCSFSNIKLSDNIFSSSRFRIDGTSLISN